MIKIVILADSFLLDATDRVNGTQVQLYNIARGLQAKGVDVYYLYPSPDPNSMYQNAEGLKLRKIPYKKNLMSWMLDIRSFKKELDDIFPDAIYQRGRSHLTFVSARWAKKNNIKFIWGSNGEDSCDFWKNIKGLFRSKKGIIKKILLFPDFLLLDILIHYGVRNADVIITQTAFQNQRLLKNYNKKGVILPSYYPVEIMDNHAAASEKKKICLWVASLSKAKQPELFLKLADKFQKIKEWKFVMLGGTGNTGYLDHIKRLCLEKENVEFVGSVTYDKTWEYFQKASLFINTSLKEADGLPNVFIQAWLCGTPVLSLNHDPNEWLKEGNYGYCSNGDLDDLAKHLQAYMNDDSLIQDVGGRCQKFAMEKFMSEHIIDNFIKLMA